ncbi:MAG: biotin-dependent carboxyltransferase family protein [Ignavibacteriales bacterium]|nr:biotin-dependent carboxyltransferase family protein [Ignavibacteriales bacterium]
MSLALDRGRGRPRSWTAGRYRWYQAFLARAGQALDIRHCTRGMRAYLAAGGGIDVPVRLGSRSTSLAAGFGGIRGPPAA